MRIVPFSGMTLPLCQFRFYLLAAQLGMVGIVAGLGGKGVRLVRKSFLAIVLMYGLLFAGSFYWQLCAPIQDHPANPRYYQMFKERRGAVYDRNGLALAESAPDGEIFARTYSTASLSHVVGYFHQRYGMTGLERIFHEDLSRGRSLITTLDLAVQQSAEEALKGRGQLWS